jgi:tetratricopeptide (TPR) repeat protein
LTWELYDEMLQASPADPRWMRNVALVHKYMSSMYMGELPPEQRDLDRGLQHAEKAVELDERRSAAMPDDAQARLDLAFSLSTLVSAWDRKGDLKKATAYATRSEEIRKALWEADPKNYQARDRLANALVRTADLYLRQGDRKSALQRLREAIEHTEALSRISQSWVTFDTTAWAHFDLARLYEESHSREVCPQWTRAARAVRRVVDAGNGSNYSNDQQRLQTIQTKLAQCGLKMPESDR